MKRNDSKMRETNILFITYFFWYFYLSPQQKFIYHSISHLLSFFYYYYYYYFHLLNLSSLNKHKWQHTIKTIAMYVCHVTVNYSLPIQCNNKKGLTERTIQAVVWSVMFVKRTEISSPYHFGFINFLLILNEAKKLFLFLWCLCPLWSLSFSPQLKLGRIYKTYFQLN